jgi:predicted thioesterase
MMTTKNENMVTVQLKSVEAIGFTGMNQQQIQALLGTALKIDLIVHGCNGKQVKFEIMQDVEVENITVEDKDGNEIQDAEHISF